MKKIIAIATLLATCLVSTSAAVFFPSQTQPAVSILKNGALYNELVSAKFSPRSGKYIVRGNGKEIAKCNGNLFTIVLGNGESIPSTEMNCVVTKPETLKGVPVAPRLSDRLPGKAVGAKFTTKDGNVSVEWRAVLRDGSAYIRQEFLITAKKDTAMTKFVALDATLAGTPKVVGNTRGSPVATENSFAALETPLGINEVKDGKVTGTWSRKTTLKKGEKWRVSSVIGILVPGQERRSFLAYHERERAMPWRTMIHYNSWYELGSHRQSKIDDRMNEAECLEIVNAWNDKLFKKHKVGIDAFAWDDGWDDWDSLWEFYKPAFPNGFKRIDKAASVQKAGVGAWLGPVGGYYEPKRRRIAAWNAKHPGKKVSNFNLADPDYIKAFVGSCGKMIDDYDMRYFKIDGISTRAESFGPVNEEDAESIIAMLEILREKRADVFFNCTVGTWASPFWFHFADSIWRQGGDCGQRGIGNSREKWITFRDWKVHQIFTKGSPLTPINSLMVHGLIVSKRGAGAGFPKDVESIKHEMRCAFASGSALQELYVDHDLMTAIGKNEELWKELADCIKWFRGNADVFDDVHWVGNDPWENDDGAVYGWAAWNTKKSTLALRNSSDKQKTLTTTLRNALDVPAFVKGRITLKNSFKDQRVLSGITNVPVDLDKEISFKLKPFEVFVFDGVPAK